MKLIEKSVYYICYGTVTLGCVTAMLGFSKFIMSIIEDYQSLLTFMFMLFGGVVMLLLLLAIGVCLVAILEELLGDENSKIYQLFKNKK